MKILGYAAIAVLLFAVASLVSNAFRDPDEAAFNDARNRCMQEAVPSLRSSCMDFARGNYQLALSKRKRAAP